MKIEHNKVVQFHYRLRETGSETEIENSHSGDPVAYLHGHNNIIRGLEEAMLGKEAGDVFTADIKAVFAYGNRVEGSQQRVPIKHLLIKKNTKLTKGMIVSVQTDQGERQATVIKAGKFNVDIDTNHPLAGKDLTFDIEIIDIREAAEEEISHGHAHGIGGHQH